MESRRMTTSSFISTSRRGLLQHHPGDPHMIGAAAVGGRGHDLRLGDRAPHLGHLFRAFVDQQDDEVHPEVVAGNRRPDLLQQDRLAGLGRGDDEASLPLPDRSDEVHHPQRERGAPRSRQFDPGSGMLADEIDVVAARRQRLDGVAVHLQDGVEFGPRWTAPAPAAAGRTVVTENLLPDPEPMPVNEPEGNPDIRGPGKKVVLQEAQVAGVARPHIQQAARLDPGLVLAGRFSSLAPGGPSVGAGRRRGTRFGITAALRCPLPVGASAA